ncbi:helix-turn-helix domain-containing protein [Nocardioides sp. QY071]|uniref:helix-turn-helix domain-containing protein n=1 Tax=Nocardioides sp. QY071 TaxID=3044187 RepID=UPI00249AA34D|nr:GAF domain-containing protein [Nocardioides sp. QY071]WGY00326.1 helix-turn-helix domain-containing protein [Nocardioides sp. QY071]
MDAQAALEAWLKVSRALVEHRPLTEILDVIAEVARDLTGHLYAMVALADDRSERLVVQGSAGLPPEYLTVANVDSPLVVGGEQGRSETPSARAFRTGRPVTLPDLFADEALVDWRTAAGRQGYRSLVSIPLAGPGELGVLTVYGAAAGTFEQSQIDLLSALAKGAAAAIEIARLRERELTMMAELEEVDLMHQRLNRAALEGKGLDPILRSLAEMTGYDILIEEYAGREPIAAWPQDHAGPDLPAAERERLRATACQTLELASRSSEDHVVYVAPIVLAGEIAALLWASGEDRTMSGIHRMVFERGAIVSSLELLSQRHAQDVEWRMRGDLVRDLLNLEASGAPRILERARSYGHDLTQPHVPIVIRPDPPSLSCDGKGRPTSEAALQHVISCVRSVSARSPGTSLVADHEGAVVMLLHRRVESPDLPKRTAKAITALVASRGNVTASASIGEMCVSPLDYRLATQVASSAVRLVQDAGTGGKVVEVADLGIYRLLLAGNEPSVLREFSERTLGPLRRPEDTRNADLVHTVRVLIENDLQAGRTAEALHIHPNTLAYRLRRIESLTGVVLRSSQGLLDMSFALAIDRLVHVS